jgi:isopentenyl-diphosphate Delta-isomerase
MTPPSHGGGREFESHRTHMLIPIVDKKDRLVMYKERSKVLFKDIYRISAIWITNSNGEILIAQRTFSKNHDPGKWGPAVAGTVEKGESYKQNAIKELKEELSIKSRNLKKGSKTFISRKHRLFCQWYTLKIDKPIKLISYDKSEVKSIKWIQKKELLKWHKDHEDDFVPSMKDSMKLFVN